MKKFFLLFWVLATSCCLVSEQTEAKTWYVQDYQREIDGIVPADITSLEKKKKGNDNCPEDFPIPETEKPTGENVSCTSAPQLYGGVKCYSCEGPCSNRNIYPYDEEDCSNLFPTGECITLSGEKRYQSCCNHDQRYYHKEELAGKAPNTDVFKYKSRTNSKGTITCYQPTGCVSGNKIYENDTNLNVQQKAAIWEVEKKGASCTSLRVLPVLGNVNLADNFFCPTGYSCNGSCQDGAENHANNVTCIHSLTKDTSLSSYYSPVNCYYYPGCANDTVNCYDFSSGTINEDIMNVTKSSEVSFWYSNSNSMVSGKRCVRFNNCKTVVGENYMYGGELLVAGSGINIQEVSLGTGDRKKRCYIYTCKEDGWIPYTGLGDLNVSNLLEGGQYEASYIEGNGKWFACRKIIPGFGQCFNNCSVGGWYNVDAKDCYTDGTTSDKIVISKTDATAEIATTRNVLQGYNAIMAMDKSNFLSLGEAGQIAGQLLSKYGEGRCFVVNTGVVELQSDGRLDSINSQESFELHCGTTLGPKTDIVKIGDEDDSSSAIDCAVITDCLACNATPICYWEEATTADPPLGSQDDGNNGGLNTISKCTVGSCKGY